MLAGREDAGAAIGLGLGMVPGVSIAVLVGATVRVSVARLLEPGAAPEVRHARAGRAHEALEQIQHTINAVVVQIDETPDEEERQLLTEWCEGLKQLARTRRSALEDS